MSSVLKLTTTVSLANDIFGLKINEGTFVCFGFVMIVLNYLCLSRTLSLCCCKDVYDVLNFSCCFHFFQASMCGQGSKCIATIIVFLNLFGIKYVSGSCFSSLINNNSAFYCIFWSGNSAGTFFFFGIFLGLLLQFVATLLKKCMHSSLQIFREGAFLHSSILEFSCLSTSFDAYPLCGEIA